MSYMKNTSHRQSAQTRGFTLLEMLMTMAIAAIVLTIGIPSFRYVTNSNRIAGELNGLLGTCSSHAPKRSRRGVR